MIKTYSGRCFCGLVQIEVSGAAEVMGYCHCRSCRSWSASPVNAFTLWKPSQVRVIARTDYVVTYSRTEMSDRKFCRICGGHVMASHPTLDLIDFYAATIPDYPFAPEIHINYAERVLSITDGLPKLKDFPIAFGGSGEIIAD